MFEAEAITGWRKVAPASFRCDALGLVRGCLRQSDAGVGDMVVAMSDNDRQWGRTEPFVMRS